MLQRSSEIALLQNDTKSIANTGGLVAVTIADAARRARPRAMSSDLLSQHRCLSRVQHALTPAARGDRGVRQHMK